MSPDEVIGKPLKELFQPEIYSHLEDGLLDIFTSGLPVDELYPARFDNMDYWFHVKLTPIKDKNGNIKQVLGISRDVTELKRTEEALRESEQKFRLVADFTHSWESWIDPNGNYVFISPACERITGHMVKEFFRNPELLIDLIHPEDRPAYMYHKKTHIDKPVGAAEIDFRIVSASGEVRWISHLCQPVFGSNGEWLGRRESNRDITERKRAEEALRESEHIKMVLMDNIPETMLLIDRDGIILDANSILAKKFGKDKKELIGSCVYDHFDPDTARLRRMKIVEVFRTGRPIRFEDMGAGSYFDNIVSPVFSEDGKVEKASIIAIDITGRKQAEDALEDAKSQAELYLDLMGHDINNMNQVGMGFLELALDRLNLDEDKRLLISKPLAAFESSSRLIENVKKLQKVRAGEVPTKEMDIGQVLEDVQHHYSNMHGNRITINYSSVHGYKVTSNELLYDLFSNLVGNAIKHSNGNPVIDIKAEKVIENGREYARVIVDDNGPGIPDELKARIFHRNLRGNSKAKGSGIGLYLVNALVENYRGRVWVEDRVQGERSKGSRFVIMLPAVEK